MTEETTIPPVAERAMGPVITLSAGPLWGVSVLAPAAFGGLAWAGLSAIAPSWIPAVWPACLAVAAAFAATVGAVRPWTPRPVARWLQWWMGALGIVFLVTVAGIVGLIYISPPALGAATGVLGAACHFATLIALAVVFARQVKERSEQALREQGLVEGTGR